MIHRRRMMAAALAAIAIPCIPWANTAASRPSNAAATNPNHRDPGGPIAGAGRAVTGDGMVSAGFGSGRNGDCSSSSASAPISVSVIASLLRPHRNHLRHHGRWKIGLPASCLRVIGSDPLVRHRLPRRSRDRAGRPSGAPAPKSAAEGRKGRWSCISAVSASLISAVPPRN